MPRREREEQRQEETEPRKKRLFQPARGDAPSRPVGSQPSAAAAAAALPIAGGSLPVWAPWAVLVAVAAILTVLGIGIAAMLVLAVIVSGVVTYIWSRAVEGRRKATDRGVTFLVTAAFAVAVAPLISLLYTVIQKGAARFDADFFTISMRGVIGEGGGAYHAIVGTLIITACATVISVPIGVMTAIYLQEYGTGRRLARAVTFFVDVMTGIPSIVAGLFAYAVFAIFFGPGVRLGIIGAVALSVLMIPIVVRSTEEMLRIVPNHLREAAYALGVPKWRTIVKVVLPTSLAGILTGVMLAIARIIGETAPLLITTGVVTSMNFNPFDGRMMNLAVYAFSQYKSPGVPPEPAFERAWSAALTLIIIVMVLNLLARLLYRRFGTEVR
ncbi:MAG TPA: phosphate ABC transporter permease PstA [Solirubrobacteraceae bacterium]|nr:phosphate ABC transporter permease PstA [Solirubrobacteraceae bacterium]